MLTSLRLLLPALVPSWRFFETVQPSPRVEWRVEGGDWRAFRPRPAHVPVWRMALRLFWNPDWNEALYAVSLAERLVAEPTAHAEAEMFRLIARQGSGRVTFRLVFVTREGRAVLFHSAPRLLERSS